LMRRPGPGVRRHIDSTRRAGPARLADLTMSTSREEVSLAACGPEFGSCGTTLCPPAARHPP